MHNEDSLRYKSKKFMFWENYKEINKIIFEDWEVTDDWWLKNERSAA